MLKGVVGQVVTAGKEQQVSHDRACSTDWRCLLVCFHIIQGPRDVEAVDQSGVTSDIDGGSGHTVTRNHPFILGSSASYRKTSFIVSRVNGNRVFIYVPSPKEIPLAPPGERLIRDFYRSDPICLKKFGKDVRRISASQRVWD